MYHRRQAIEQQKKARRKSDQNPSDRVPPHQPNPNQEAGSDRSQKERARGCRTFCWSAVEWPIGGTASAAGNPSRSFFWRRECAATEESERRWATEVGPGRSGNQQTRVSFQPGHKIVLGSRQPGSRTGPGNQTYPYCMKWAWS